MASCIGASWVYQGHKGTLEALKQMVKPGGLVLTGEPFWRIPPQPEYLKLTEQDADSFGSHSSNVQAGVDLGLTFLYSIVSSEDDWDRYEDSSGRLPKGTCQPIPMIRTRRRSSIPPATAETVTCGGGVTAWAGPCTFSVRP